MKNAKRDARCDEDSHDKEENVIVACVSFRELNISTQLSESVKIRSQRMRGLIPEAHRTAEVMHNDSKKKIVWRHESVGIDPLKPSFNEGAMKPRPSSDASQ